MIVIGYLVGNRNQPAITTPVVIQNCISSPPEIIYVPVKEPSMCTMEGDYEMYEDQMYEDDIYEDEISEPETYEIEPLEIPETKSSYSIQNLTLIIPESKPSAQLMLGYRKSGVLDTTLNIPVHERLGFYVGYNTAREYSLGASINLF
jgi:hypothetical protein